MLRTKGALLHKPLMTEATLTPAGFIPGLCDRDAKRDVAVHDGDADLDFRDLSVKVPRHEALSQQFGVPPV